MNLITSILTLCGWTLWGYTVLLVDPEIPMAPLGFYASLFVASTCTLARLLRVDAPSEPGAGASSAYPAMGHAAIVSTLLLFALWLQSLRMLTPFNGILLATTFVFIELGFYFSRDRGRARPRRRPTRRSVPDLGIGREP